MRRLAGIGGGAPSGGGGHPSSRSSGWPAPPISPNLVFDRDRHHRPRSPPRGARFCSLAFRAPQVLGQDCSVSAPNRAAPARAFSPQAPDGKPRCPLGRRPPRAPGSCRARTRRTVPSSGILLGQKVRTLLGPVPPLRPQFRGHDHRLTVLPYRPMLSRRKSGRNSWCSRLRRGTDRKPLNALPVHDRPGRHRRAP